jgi:predicted nucleotidyltransferase component of viral defense system
MSPDLHNDPDLFKASLSFTAEQTGFAPSLIEKDYLCSVLLGYLSLSSDASLIFKGGTCLAKVYFDFNRLSEDLDFIISTPVDAKRKERSTRIAACKKALSDLPKAQGVFRVKDPLEGRNESRQYLATIAYTSFIDGHEDTIKLKVGLREPLLIPPADGEATTILRNAANPDKPIALIPCKCLSFEEMMAEKFRAALSRKDIAVRDFYDVDYAVLHKGLKTDATSFIEMVRKKLSIPGNHPANTSDDRLAQLRAQLEARLKPVLRAADYEAFDLDRAIGIVKKVHRQLQDTGCT